MDRTGERALRVVLCDDHEIVREAIRARLGGAAGVEVVAEAGDGRELVEIVRRLAPDVAIVDLELPGRDGIATTREIRAVCPQTGVVILTAHAEPELLAPALRAGARGYLLKSGPLADVEEAVRAVVGGSAFFGVGFRPAGPVGLEGLLALSAREREILGLLGEGLRAADIAARLSLKRATVHSHVRKAVDKLGAATRTEAVALAERYSYLGGRLRP